MAKRKKLGPIKYYIDFQGIYFNTLIRNSLMKKLGFLNKEFDLLISFYNSTFCKNFDFYQTYEK